ncbi:hypothetical protein [Actinoallomurus vinaceus]|uniref:nSTAND1 domain-containing NTPase n=1 Tax=Actinoallomurus vinaceus TaxID=1080074 RepID=UPI0031E6F4DB
MSVESRGDLPDLARGGVARSVRSAAKRVRSWTPPVLLAVLSAGAFAPLLLSGVGASALVGAGISAVTAVGGSVLADVVKAAVESLGAGGREPSDGDLETELERRFQEVLDAGGESAERLRAEIAGVLREFGLVGTAIEAAVQSGDRELQVALAEGLAGLAAEFSEFSFVLSDVGGQLRAIREGVDQQRAELQIAVDLQYRQATDTRLMLDRLAVIERRTRSEGDQGGAGSAEGVRWRDGSPYKGLATYREADAEVFFGREVVTAQLVSTLSQRLTGPGMVVMTGASGAGKSSLLRAGLFPAIARGDLSESARHWPRLVLDQPTRSPLSHLATLLAGLAGIDAPTVLDALRRAPKDASLLVRQAVDHDARRRELPPEIVPACRMILVVDQFEEVFATGDGEEAASERAAFIAALHAAATVPTGATGTPAALVVIAVRGDVIDRCADHPELVEALQERQFVLGAMTEPELRAAITVPAGAAGLEIEPGLVDTILAELRSPAGGFDAGTLPLLSQTMLTVWEHREGNRLTGRGYALTGGVTHAVATSAEAAFDGLDRDRRDLARRMFQQLTAVSPEARLTRRTVSRTALAEMKGGDDPAEVLEVFAKRRLIVVDTGSVQIAHDALLLKWPRLRQWMEADLTGQALRSQLSDAAEQWNGNDRAPSYLYRGTRLAAIRQAEARWQDDPLTGLAREFLDASAHAENRGRRRRRLTLTALSGLAVAALVLAGLALVQARTAREQERIATARQLVSKAETALDTDPRTALMLNVAAHRIHPDPETYASLQRAITTTPFAGQLTGVKSQVGSIAYSPSGRYLAAGFATGQVMLWDLRDPLRPRALGRPFTAFDSPVTTAAFSSNERRLVTASSAGFATVWDLSDPARPQPVGNPLKGEKYRDGKAQVSRDGTVLATSSKEKPGLQLWDLTDPAGIRRLGPPFAAQGKQLSAIGFSPDGTRIAAAGIDAPVMLWDIERRDRPRLLGRVPVQRDIAYSLSFSADGKLLAVGGSLRGTALWNVSDPARPRPARDLIRVTFFSKATFSPQGPILATTGSRDTGLLLWDVTSPDFPERTERLTAGADDVTMAFSPDGHMVASGGDEGQVTLWNLKRAGHPRPFGAPLVGHKTGRYKEIYSLAMSQDGTMIATGGRDTTVELWDVADRARPRRLGTLTGHTGEGVDAVAFSPDGRTLATGDGKETVILWDLTDRVRPRRLTPSLTGPIGIVRSLLFTPDGKSLLMGGDDGTILWDVRQPGRPRRLARVLSNEGVLGIWRVRDGRTLALLRGSQSRGGPTTEGVMNGTRLWDITNPRHPLQRGPALTGHTKEVVFAAMSPTGDLAATSDADGAVILWDLHDPAHPRRLGDPLVPHGSNAPSVVFAPTTDIMVTGGIDGNAYLWDLGNRILPRQLGTALTDNLDTVGHMVFSANGETLATAGSAGDVVLWDLKPTYELRRHLVETTCLVTGGGLNREQWTRYLPAFDYQNTCTR